MNFLRCGAFLQRATRIDVQYQDLQGNKCEMQLRDFVARVFQHEYDHLQVGRLHSSLMSYQTRDGVCALYDCCITFIAQLL